MNCDNIPQEIKALNQWVVFRSYLCKESNKYKKVIISPVTKEYAKSNESKGWTSFSNAVDYYKKNKFSGLAFVLTEGITFIDIDNSIDNQIGISNLAKELLDLLPDTFVQRSTSGKGIHILLKGSLPENALKRKDSVGLEMYDTKRFVCMTGDVINERFELKDYSHLIEQVNFKYIGKRPEPKVFNALPFSISDIELINKIRNSKQATKFDRLFSGDKTGYPSQSNADFALASILAWWTQDESQIERIFRSSGLLREKFDRRIGSSTYGLNLISDAIANQSSFYTPSKPAYEM